MKKHPLREGFNKGVIFSIIIIFLVLVGFHVIAATMVSKLLGTAVLRGGIPDFKFMTYIHILFGIWVGWSATSKEGNTRTKLLQGLVAGITVSIFISLFDLVINQLVITQTEVRQYLSALSFENIELFLLGRGQTGILVHIGLYTLCGFAGSALAVFFRSNKVKTGWQNFISFIKNTNSKVNDSTPIFIKKYGKYLLYLVVAVILFVLPTKWGSYWNYVVGLVGLYVIAGIGLNIIVGLSGQLVLGYAAFFAMGAYGVALLNAPVPHNLMWGFWPALVIAIFIAIISAVVLGLPIMQLRGDYLAIVTLGFGEIIRILLKSDLLTDFSGGPRGIQDIQGPTLFGKPFSSDIDYVYLIFVGIALSIFVYNRLQDSRTGRAWLAIKEDPIAAQATGVSLQKYKLLALCIGAAFAGLAGGIFSARNQFTGPNDHALMVSMNILSLIIVGGVNSIPGIILGAFALKGLPEILREIESFRLLAFGALLIAMMLMRPDGLWPATRPAIEKAERDKAEKAKSKKGAKDA